MKKVHSSETLRKADAYTIKNEPISSLDLMERAARLCFEQILKQYPDQSHFDVVCGMGNNGGDGLVIARLLADVNKEVRIFIIKHKDEGSQDFHSNLDRLPIKPLWIDESNYSNIKYNEVVIDAVLGTGLNQPLKGLIKDVVSSINKQSVSVVSIDIPTGIFDQNNNDISRESAIKAIHTLTFECPKYSFLLPENDKNIGHWEVLDIGLNKTFLDQQNSFNFIIDPQYLHKHLLNRKPHDHKGVYGHALLYGSCDEMPGAIQLSAEACLRSGPGKVSVLTEHNNPTEFHVHHEIMFELNKDDLNFDKFTSIGIGPGLSLGPNPHQQLQKILQSYKKPIVADADALTIIAEDDLLMMLPRYSIITPHPKEFDRLFGRHTTRAERIEKAKAIAEKCKIIIVLKGRYTAIIDPKGNTYFNTTGNPGMAKGGSGDVLTGIIAGLLARGYTPLIAAQLGVYLHGLSGDIAKQKFNQESMLPSDIIKAIPEAMKIIYSE